LIESIDDASDRITDLENSHVEITEDEMSDLWYELVAKYANA